MLPQQTRTSTSFWNAWHYQKKKIEIHSTWTDQLSKKVSPYQGYPWHLIDFWHPLGFKEHYIYTNQRSIILKHRIYLSYFKLGMFSSQTDLAPGPKESPSHVKLNRTQMHNPWTGMKMLPQSELSMAPAFLLSNFVKDIYFSPLLFQQHRHVQLTNLGVENFIFTKDWFSEKHNHSTTYAPVSDQQQVANSWSQMAGLGFGLLGTTA